MKWNRIISALVLPLVIYTFAEKGHFCLSILTARVDTDTPATCCCSTHEDVTSSSAQQKSCCGQENQDCRCSIHTAGFPLESVVIKTHFIGAIACSSSLHLAGIHHNPALRKGSNILIEPVSCFATTHWRKIRLTC